VWWENTIYNSHKLEKLRKWGIRDRAVTNVSERIAPDCAVDDAVAR